MGEAIIKGLIGLCLVVLAVFLIFWVIAELGLGIPPMVEKIVWIVVVLIAILMFYRALKSGGAGWLP